MNLQRQPRNAVLVRVASMVVALACLASGVAAAESPAASHTITVVASTVPANGDVNPYGIFVVPRSVGNLVKGNLLISNFNAVSNHQGTGTTIMQISPGGAVSQFAQINASSLPGTCTGGIGLTTALIALRSGWVIVGSLPTTDGTAATAQAGCLLVLDPMGNVVETIYGTLINGPWDMAVLDHSNVNGGGTAALFVTNVLNGTVSAVGSVVNQGTVVRVDLTLSKSAPPFVEAMTVIGSGFAERTDPAALVIGPTGVGLSPDGLSLYVADSLNNRIAAIPFPITRQTTAHTGVTVTRGGSLNDPLGLAVAPNGDILTANGDDGYMLQTTPDGLQAAKTLLDSSGDPPGSGALFGLVTVGQSVYYVDDATNTLNLFH
ncbi:MAG TPA: SMP-30/gluconolactonase/LRE family protein [Terriglobales bacterium]|nr:SMP-30/gluconolactonase/LRE family protein [Terriglobales bacterium]